MTSAFLLSLAMVVLAEMGDKTQLLAMAFATRYRWQTVMWGVFAATLLNHLMAVVAGNALTSVVPIEWIKTVAAVSFILFGLWTIRGDKLDGEDNRAARNPFWTVAIAFFIAEIGDKTQLMTVALAAGEAARATGTGLMARLGEIIPVWMGTTCGMLIADGFGIIVGIILHKRIPEKAVKWGAASIFVVFGLLGLDSGLDVILRATIHHVYLVVAIPILAALMWLVSRLTSTEETASVAMPD